jgi:sporulation integral membrane protein YlbJ
MNRRSYALTVLYALLSLFLVLMIIAFPNEAYTSSLRGLKIWWDVVFPALLPFFITAEILIGFGVVHFLGVLLEPIMRPLFRVPGAGGFILSMGLASGYPMGSKLSVQLRQQGLVTRVEGERLVALTSTSGPLFMFGAVAVGFFHDVTLGIMIAVAHYLGAFSVGCIMRFYRYRDEPSETKDKRDKRSILYRALQAMHRARLAEKRSFGELLGDAVLSSIQTLMLVGGFIILFSVLFNMLSLVQIDALLSLFFSLLLKMIGIPPELGSALVAGMFEITLGSKFASESAGHIPLVHKVAIAGAIIAWSGLSVHAQVLSFLSKTDLRYAPYVFARLIHATLAMLFTYLLWGPFERYILPHPALAAFKQNRQLDPMLWNTASIYLFACSLILIMLTLIGITYLIAKRRAGRSIHM